MGKLDGKVAIVTGAAQGMGETHAIALHAEGAKVVLTDINEEKGQAAAERIGENALFVKQDVSSEDDWKNVVKQTNETFGDIHILVNNAGISMSKPITEMTLDDYKKIVNLNQISVFLGMKYVYESMKNAGSGSIINISSLNGLVAGAIGYTDTKFAVRGITKAAAVQFAADGIRVNSVHPGVIETPMVTEGDSYEMIKEYAKSIPIGRMAQPEEVSKLVVFLASDDSSYSTGSEFVTDGGFSAQ